MKQHTPVIIVDDDADDIEVMKEIISKIDATLRVATFTDAEHALQYLRTTSDRPFIIISDVNMPRMDGLSFRLQIFTEEQLRVKSIPFVFYTTVVEKHAVQEAYRLTVQGFFEKGGSMKDIEQMLREMFRYWERCIHPNDMR